MGQAPSAPESAPKDEAYVGGPWQMAIVMLIGVTLFMSGYDDLPPEALAFYMLISRITLVGIIGIIGHRMYHTWHFARQVEAWNAAQDEAIKNKPINPGETDAPRKMPFSYWDMAARAHPSAFLTTSLVQPRLFPFPTGLADPAKSKTPSMVWESGLPPEVGRHQVGSSMAKRKREAYVKQISERLKAEDKLKKEREEIYQNQRKHMLDRVWHLKVLSTIVVLAFVSKRIAIIAMVPFLYSVFINEIGYLIKGKSGVNVEKVRRPRPQKQPERNYRLPDSGVAYLYQPVKDGLASLQTVPLVDAAPPLLTTENERLAGDGHKERTLPTWFNWPSKAVDDSTGIDGKRETSND